MGSLTEARFNIWRLLVFGWEGTGHSVKTEWLWLLGTPGSRNFSSLTLDGVALPVSKTLGVCLGPTATAQKIVIARRTFAQVCLVHQLPPFQQWKILQTITHIVVTL